MNIEKLKPWNWFKHEDDSTSQIPVSKSEASGEIRSSSNTLTPSQNHAVDSLLQLHNEIDRFFEDARRSFGLAGHTRLMQPRPLFDNNLLEGSLLGDYRANLDVSGNDKEYEISIDLPGLTEDDIQIELNGNTLTVSGQKHEKSESKDKQYYRLERRVGCFQRTLSLPEDADSNEICANMKNGLLLIKIPRRAIPASDVKRIEISS